jgi:hypothetical protein
VNIEVRWACRPGKSSVTFTTNPASRIIFGHQLTHLTVMLWRSRVETSCEDTYWRTRHTVVHFKCVRRILRHSGSLIRASNIWRPLRQSPEITVPQINGKTIFACCDIESQEDFHLTIHVRCEYRLIFALVKLDSSANKSFTQNAKLSSANRLSFNDL